MGLTIDTKTISSKLDRMRKLLPEVRRAILQKTTLVVSEEEMKITPKDHGDLRKRLYARLNEQGTAVVTGTAGCAYAAAVHERLLSKSGNAIQYTVPGTGPKFIERAIRGKGAAYLLKAIRQEVLKGITK